MPKAIQNAPELELGLGLYYDAFWELDTCRQLGMQEGPIPWTAIYQYSMLLELDSDETLDMIYHVRNMDNCYLQHQKEKSS